MSAFLPQLETVERLKATLLAACKLYEQLEKQSSDFAPSVMSWLRAAEEILMQNKFATAAELAALRGTLIAAEKGIVPQGLSVRGRVTSRKLVAAAASHVLDAAVRLLSDAIRSPIAQMTDAERLARHLVVAGQRKGLIVRSGALGMDAIRTSWLACSQDPELAAWTVQLEGALGFRDALTVFSRVVSNMFDADGLAHLITPNH